jgi:hypothetical protein
MLAFGVSFLCEHWENDIEREELFIQKTSKLLKTKFEKGLELI